MLQFEDTSSLSPPFSILTEGTLGEVALGVQHTNHILVKTYFEYDSLARKVKKIFKKLKKFLYAIDNYKKLS